MPSSSVFDSHYRQVAVYKRPKQISGYEYEVEACLKAIDAGELECPQMPHEETIRIMDWMDGLRKQWRIVYPFEKPEETPENTDAAKSVEEEAPLRDGTESDN